jgi:hypothetical protein
MSVYPNINELDAELKCERSSNTVDDWLEFCWKSCEPNLKLAASRSKLVASENTVLLRSVNWFLLFIFQSKRLNIFFELE